MACSKYTLTNTGTTAVNFNYRRCDDSMWEYQVNLNPNETKNIWLINGTYDAAALFDASIQLVNDGAYPLTPTPTPTPSPTPPSTSTSTPTPTETPTNTPSETPTNTPSETPTNTPTVTPTNAYELFNVTSGSTPNIACTGGLSGVIYAENSAFDTNTQFYNNANGTVSGSMLGFYSFGGQVVELIDDGSETGGFSLCAVVPTPTPTITMTPTVSQTFFVTYSLGFDSVTAGGACTDSATPQAYYGAYVDRPQPNIGEYLYNDNALTIPSDDGFYSNGIAWWEITGGSGLITSTDPNGC